MKLLLIADGFATADEALQARADIHFERVDVSRLLRASGSFQGNGALNGTVRVDGTGRSIAEILASAASR